MPAVPPTTKTPLQTTTTMQMTKPQARLSCTHKTVTTYKTIDVALSGGLTASLREHATDQKESQRSCKRQHRNKTSIVHCSGGQTAWSTTKTTTTFKYIRSSTRRPGELLRIQSCSARKQMQTLQQHEKILDCWKPLQRLRDTTIVIRMS